MENAIRLSHKIYVLSFWAMISVIVIHSKTLSGNPSSWDVFIQWLCTRSLPKWAVPFFFAVSGFWFGKALELGRTTTAIYLKKFRTLLLPYLFWAVLGMVLCLPLICFNNHVMHRSLLERTVWGHSTLWGCIDDLLGVTAHAPGGNAVLWYVRALLVFFLFTPCWRFVRQKAPHVLALIALVFVVVPSYRIPILSVNTDWLGWILVGISIERFSLEGKRVKLLTTLILGVGVLVFSIAEAACEAGWLPCCTWRNWVRSMIPFTGVPFVWALYDFLPHGTKDVPSWMKLTFWCYCIHAVFTSYFVASVFYIAGKSDFVLLATMVITPFVGLSLSVTSGLILRKITPRLFALLVGGRVG